MDNNVPCVSVCELLRTSLKVLSKMDEGCQIMVTGMSRCWIVSRKRHCS